MIAVVDLILSILINLAPRFMQLLRVLTALDFLKTILTTFGISRLVLLSFFDFVAAFEFQQLLYFMHSIKC